MIFAQLKRKAERYLLPTFRRDPLALVKGRGSVVWSVEGKRYLDFFPGWGVDGLGHCHPAVVRAIQQQATRLIHVSNNYYHPWQGELGAALVKRAFPGKAFFCNSGAEAVESAIKLARKYGHEHPGTDGPRYELIAMQRSFHGRTIAAVTATGQPQYHKGFAPLLPGIVHAPFNDLAAVERAVTPRTIAVLVEPIQGEGGIHVATSEFLTGVRRLCDERGLLMMVDEVQTGMGRTGKWFAHQHYGMAPDVMMLAKALGGGFPIGAMVVRSPFTEVLGPGTHATTFGGSPLACAASLATIHVIERQRLVPRARQLGEALKRGLLELQRRFPVIREIRGMGLMLGVELSVSGKPIVEQCRAKGLLINVTQEKVLRLLPALTVTKPEIAQALAILKGVFAG